MRRGIECADFVEVDLRLARDGIPVAIHDATLDRTTDGTGPVKDYTIEELKGLDAGEGETVPAFQEILKLHLRPWGRPRRGDQGARDRGDHRLCAHGPYAGPAHPDLALLGERGDGKETPSGGPGGPHLLRTAR
ncbi:MAG: glycerophosphodiester phosphodiesterase family protein [Methanoculleus sp.]